jgi:hypothetical protein
MAVALIVAGLGLAACQPPPGEGPKGKGPAPGPTAEEGVGSIQLALSIGGGLRFDSVSYDIGGNGFHKAATIDVSKSSSFSTIVGGIPLGTGYTVTLTAQDAAHKLTGCSGSAPFSLTSAGVVPVAVNVQCHEAPITTVPPSVPVPRGVAYGLGLALLALGLARVRRPAAS